MPARSCGVLLHISSLPSPFGIGDLGPTARAFVSALASAGLKYWQFLPLTPTSDHIGNSPYSSPSAFAGNPLFISPELLLEEGWVSHADVDNAVTLHCGAVSPDRVNYPAVTAQRRAILNAAFERNYPSLADSADFSAFCREHAFWLDSYSLFTAIKERRGGESWTSWPEELKRRNPEALAEWEGIHGREVLLCKFIQYLFFRQWENLRRLCRESGIGLIGDLPIYVTHDSADVWAAPALFELSEEGQPLSVAGVPPDYFSATGQRWGNPVYSWEELQKDEFAWWIKRLEHNLRLSDLVRLDHFRGFCAYWEVPAEEETAVKGRWVKAPGRSLFSALQKRFGPRLPLIAEDLGVITADVRALMLEFGLPGMKVLQFAFGGENASANPDIPFRHSRESVVYTGTHDNPPSRDWFIRAPDRERANFSEYVGYALNRESAAEAMLRLALSSPADLAVIPMQDVLGLGAEGRMNTPSIALGNWEWRLRDCSGWASLRNSSGGPDVPAVFRRLHDLCAVYGRLESAEDKPENET
ncbi:MAG: 4-alpha-glucanotransferase [Deltaproteobacteria bacterium]|jgi:4-alpha-glucanotransferase|nr:4-alpha-glucanotransferase [Deltaproteobacteria bacterium]